MSAYSDNRSSKTLPITNEVMNCTCPTNGCDCRTIVRRYQDSTGEVYVITVPARPKEYDYEKALASFAKEVKRLPFFRLAAPVPAKTKARPAPRREAPKRSKPNPEKTSWARLPRRSPRGI